MNNKKFQEDFHDFLVESQSIFDKVYPTLNTNAKESLHTSTVRIADKNTPWSKEGYEGMVYYTEDIFDLVNPNFTTQSNESLHSMEAKYAKNRQIGTVPLKQEWQLPLFKKISHIYILLNY